MGDEEEVDEGALAKGFWPPVADLERWLMNAAKERDEGAGFLRRLLKINPSYGSFLVHDDDLASIIQLHAKRFRSKIIGSERLLRDDTAAKLLYEPLCEVCWRVVGHLFHCIFDLEDSEREFPVPKEPLGQIRMLIKTNQSLSKRLNESRRQYLKELSAHRDRQREYTDRAEAALAILEEQPVMFYEPLDFVLDAETKQFVQEVVEERLKLDMSQVTVKKRKEKQESAEIGEQDSNKVYQELCKLRAELERTKATAERATAEAQRLKEQTERYKEQLEEKDKNIGDLKEQIEKLTKQRNDLMKQLQGKPGQPTEPGQPSQGGFQVIEKETIKEVIVERLVEVPAKIIEKIVPGADMSGELTSLQEKIDELERLLEDERNKPPEVQIQSGPTKTVKAEPKKAGDKTVFKEAKTKIVKGDVEIQEVIVEVENPKLRLELEKHLEIEKELRAANKALEDALREAQANKGDKKQKAAPVVKVPGESRGPTDAEIEEAMEKVTEEHKKKLKAQADEIARLKKLVEELEERLAAKGQKKPKTEPVEEETESKQKVKVKTETVYDTTETEKWKGKFKDLHEQHEELENKNEQLQEQIRILLQKLQQYGGEEAVREVMRDFKIQAPPPKKAKKENAFQRLYRDALRRIDVVKIRAEEMQKEETTLIFRATAYVRDKKSLAQVVALTHLQKAAAASQDRFHEALGNFHADNSAAAVGEDAADESGTSDAEGLKDLAHAGGNSRGTCTCGGGGWAPDLVASEFQRLRAEHLALQEEVERLRALVPGGANQGPSLRAFGLAAKAVLRAEKGAGKQHEPTSQPLFNPLSKQGASRGTREAQMVSGPDRSNSPPATPTAWNEGLDRAGGSRQDHFPLSSSASVPSLLPAWRPVASDAILWGDGQSISELLRSSTPQVPPRGELGPVRPASRNFGGGGSPPGTASSVLTRPGPNSLLVGVGVDGFRPQSSNVRSGHLDGLFADSSVRSGHLDSLFAGSSISTTAGEPSVDQVPAGLHSPARQASAPSLSDNKGPKRRSRQKDDNYLNGPVKARHPGFCVTALRSQEQLSSLDRHAVVF